MSTTQGCLAFDYDGVVHESPKYHWPPTALDTSVMREAMARGYAVAVVTCNVGSLVGDALIKQGFKVYVDKDMTRSRWAETGTVLVTNRKIAGVLAYIDDRAIRWSYGQDPAIIWDIVEATHFTASTHTKPRRWPPRFRHFNKNRSSP